MCIVNRKKVSLARDQQADRSESVRGWI